MAFKLEIGQYYRTDSPIHRLDPRVKFCCALALMIGAFFITTPLQLALGVAAVVALLALSHVPVSKSLASIKPVVVLLVVLSLFNLFWVTGGDVLVSAGPFTITTASLWAAVLYTMRFVLAILVGSLILLTTTPTELTDAFDAMLGPLNKVGLPGHEIAMVLSLILRFIPTLADEASTIIDAQTVRGGALGEGTVRQRVRSVIPVVVALLASSMRHANGLSRALDARCYEGGEGRTHFHELRMGWQDIVAMLVTVALLVALLALGGADATAMLP